QFHRLGQLDLGVVHLLGGGQRQRIVVVGSGVVRNDGQQLVEGGEGFVVDRQCGITLGGLGAADISFCECAPNSLLGRSEFGRLGQLRNGFIPLLVVDGRFAQTE